MLFPLVKIMTIESKGEAVVNMYTLSYYREYFRNKLQKMLNLYKKKKVISQEEELPEEKVKDKELDID